MSLQEITVILKLMKKELKKQFKVRRIAIFGSYARGEENNNSDVDIMVEFDEAPGIEFIELADKLEEALHLKVDLVSRKAIKPRLFKQIEKELIYA